MLPLIEATLPTTLSPRFVCRRCNGKSCDASRSLNRTSALRAGTVDSNKMFMLNFLIFECELETDPFGSAAGECINH